MGLAMGRRHDQLGHLAALHLLETACENAFRVDVPADDVVLVIDGDDRIERRIDQHLGPRLAFPHGLVAVSQFDLIASELRFQRQFLGIPLLAPKQQQRQDRQGDGNGGKQDVAEQLLSPTRGNAIHCLADALRHQAFGFMQAVDSFRHRRKPVFRIRPEAVERRFPGQYPAQAPKLLRRRAFPSGLQRLALRFACRRNEHVEIGVLAHNPFQYGEKVGGFHRVGDENRGDHRPLLSGLLLGAHQCQVSRGLAHNQGTGAESVAGADHVYQRGDGAGVQGDLIGNGDFEAIGAHPQTLERLQPFLRPGHASVQIQCFEMSRVRDLGAIRTLRAVGAGAHMRQHVGEFRPPRPEEAGGGTPFGLQRMDQFAGGDGKPERLPCHDCATIILIHVADQVDRSHRQCQQWHHDEEQLPPPDQSRIDALPPASLPMDALGPRPCGPVANVTSVTSIATISPESGSSLRATAARHLRHRPAPRIYR